MNARVDPRQEVMALSPMASRREDAVGHCFGMPVQIVPYSYDLSDMFNFDASS